MKFSKVMLGIVLVGVIGVTAYGVDRNRKSNSGFCFAEKRYLSDNEVVDAAVTQLLKKLEEEYLSMTSEQQANTIVYKGLRDFYETQPRCCGWSKDTGKSNRPNKPRKMPSGQSFYRDIIYRHDKLTVTPFRRARVFVEICGGAVSVAHEEYEGKRLLTGRPTDHDPNSELNKMNDRRLQNRKK